jgi:hypothetical protein
MLQLRGTLVMRPEGGKIGAAGKRLRVYCRGDLWGTSILNTMRNVSGAEEASDEPVKAEGAGCS